jgi:2-keto-4-pentenoate hydratase/2-oxohepta-3-ene-1,7-dioic acid hydratase in catechol pathway
MSLAAAWPTHLAWFAHRVDGARRLGVFDPGSQRLLDIDRSFDPAAEQQHLRGASLAQPELAALAARGRALDPATIEWDTPLRRPGKILCLGKNFLLHAREFGAEVPEEPIFFTKLPDTLLPHHGAIVLPHWVTSRIDHEVELGVVLGFADPLQRGRKYVSEVEALQLVAGYTVLNDVTARTMQHDDRSRQQPWLRCKSFDTFLPLGPMVVPADALPRDVDLAIECRVNDTLRQSSRTSLMVVGVAAAIAYLSKHVTLRPGDLIAMGTPEGVGPLQDGDRVTCSIEGLGSLVNSVVRETAPS